MLPDLLQPDLLLVICGTAVGNASAERQQYYAGRGNKFWKTLYEVGLTGARLEPAEYRRLLDYRIGLTDLVKLVSGMDKHLKETDFDRPGLVAKMERYQPRVLCFNGKKAAETYLLRKPAFGLQPERIGATRIFVAPSTSGAANSSWDINLWRALAALCQDGE